MGVNSRMAIWLIRRPGLLHQSYQSLDMAYPNGTGGCYVQVWASGPNQIAKGAGAFSPKRTSAQLKVITNAASSGWLQ